MAAEIRRFSEHPGDLEGYQEFVRRSERIFAKGGTGAIVTALVRLFEELGGRLRLNAEVGELATEGRRATRGRLTWGEELKADTVVCNAKVAAAYQRLVPTSVRKKYTDRRLARMRYSMSLVVIYFGTDRQYRGGDGPLWRTTTSSSVSATKAYSGISSPGRPWPTTFRSICTCRR
ncbi:MAG TPA: FAD-dependent oxidoreductase [Thermomicrobiales bacterium]|nr:FAD-dependent oxidoreductase [Thermomicrobiales bacterium]